jgi:hypothetical protein
MRAFDEMMRANISHDLRSRENLGVELILELPPLLEDVSLEELGWIGDVPSLRTWIPSC